MILPAAGRRNTVHLSSRRRAYVVAWIPATMRDRRSNGRHSVRAAPIRPQAANRRRSLACFRGGAQWSAPKPPWRAAG